MAFRDIEGAYQGALRAFKTPMLDLLHQTYAPFVVTMLASMFTADRPTVTVADAQAEIGDALNQLRSSGYGEDGQLPLPTGNARELCRYWVNAGWLICQALEDNTEVYRLSAHGVGALEVAGRVAGSRTRVSESRVRTLLDAVERLAQNSDPNLADYVARLETEIAQRQQELRRMEAGGDIEAADDDQLVEEAENVLHLARELPADFARVAESIKAIQREVVTDLRQDIRPTGEVLREYLERGQQIMDATPEGRAFAGALRLIGDPEQIDELSSRLRTVSRHRFTIQMSEPQRREFTEIARRIERGVKEVLTAQRQASHVITTQVRNHDPMRDRQVDELLRDVVVGLHREMRDLRRGEAIQPLRRLPTLNIDHLRQTVTDPRPAVPPPPLAEWDYDTTQTTDTRVWGGPNYLALAAYLAEYPANEHGFTAVADAFGDAPEDIRRPVDLLGLLELSHRAGMTETEEVVTVEAIRPDGTRRQFAFGGVLSTPKREKTEDRDGRRTSTKSGRGLGLHQPGIDGGGPGRIVPG
ncbi:DUF3375 domain-containing protein [Nocardia panacis]|uniref:DUF3375 domain-containing protein n=1 Tax=Nocardia panacis TaxID=2340916 RepID=A0A3A4KCK5_9NOCA|nr:DUF3375 domain-containing protein [Nocardia panacis]RJO70032.1 DUF3375 domain-containing protein [Nocardia panacis]